MTETKMVNDYLFAHILDEFKRDVLDPFEIEQDKAFKIVTDLHYKWQSEDQKKLAEAKYDKIATRNAFYKKMYKAGMDLVLEHEGIVNHLSKWYSIWYSDISNEGKQETEMMEAQADMLQGIFVEIYQALKPLGLDLKIPAAMNL